VEHDLDLGLHIREAGSTAAQELAFTLAKRSATWAWLTRGLDVDRFAPQLSFFWDLHSDFFEEIAKLRAARPHLGSGPARKIRAKDPRSWKMRFHCQTAASP